MKKPQFIAIGIAAVCGLLAFMMFNSLVSKKPEVKTKEVVIDATEVLVAKTDIALGQVVTDQHMKFIKWPRSAVQKGFLTSKMRGIRGKLAGSIARAPMIAGEVITKHKLIKPGEGGVLAAILPKGKRAVATAISTKTAVGGLILPNDHVDVILTREVKVPGSDEPQLIADTLFRNVRVLAIGQQIETKEGSKSTSSGGARSTTATLELNSKQAEMIALANKAGTISLSLRSVADLNKNGKTTVGADLDSERGGSVDVLRYGVPQRAFGVN